MIEISPLIDSEPTRHPRPAKLDGFHCFRRDGFEAFVHVAKVLRRIAHWARQRRRVEVIGVLVGRAYQDECGRYVIITDVLLAENSDSHPSRVGTTPQDCASFVRAMKNKFPAAEIVGWFHSHIFDLHDYSSIDRRNQASWDEPHNLGLLVVVGEDETRVHAFRGPESERLSPTWVYSVSEVADEPAPPADDAASASASDDAARRMFHLEPVAGMIVLVLWPLVFATFAFQSVIERMADRAELRGTVERLLRRAEAANRQLRRNSDEIEAIQTQIQTHDELMGGWLFERSQNIFRQLSKGDDHEDDRASGVP